MGFEPTPPKRQIDQVVKRDQLRVSTSAIFARARVSAKDFGGEDFQKK